jgi:hypothetical protein
MLAAIEFDNHVRVATNEVDVIPTYWFLVVELETAVVGRQCVSTT